MKKLMIVSAAAVAIMATGCVSVHKNDGAKACLAPCVVKDKVHMKYDVKKRTVQGKDVAFCLFGWFLFGSNASHIADHAPSATGAAFLPNVRNVAANGAYAVACDAAGADAIVGARYKIKVEDYFVFQKATAEITGYPAKLTGVELIEACPGKCPLKK